MAPTRAVRSVPGTQATLAAMVQRQQGQTQAVQNTLRLPVPHHMLPPNIDRGTQSLLHGMGTTHLGTGLRLQFYSARSIEILLYTIIIYMLCWFGSYSIVD